MPSQAGVIRLHPKRPELRAILKEHEGKSQGHFSRARPRVNDMICSPSLYKHFQKDGVRV